MTYSAAKVYLFLLLFCGSCLLLSSAFGENDFLIKYFKLQESRNILLETITKLEQETLLLEEEIHKIKNSKSYVHKILRDKYHLINEDEEIIFFAD